jgi:hypothetical protein
VVASCSSEGAISISGSRFNKFIGVCKTSFNAILGDFDGDEVVKDAESIMSWGSGGGGSILFIPALAVAPSPADVAAGAAATVLTVGTALSMGIGTKVDI